MADNQPKKGTLYLIPSSLGEDDLSTVWPSGNLNMVDYLDTFIVENLRTARRFLRKAGYNKDFDEVTFFLLDKHTGQDEWHTFVEPCLQGVSVGLLSEAGCPGIADPGQNIVARAHALDIKVKPLTGASSIILAIMASGMNGQQFCFHGYLPVARDERIKKFKALEQESYRNGATQVFIETPYRNNALLKDVLQHARAGTQLAIACEITTENEMIKTKTVSQWLRQPLPDLHKKPAVFLISR